VIRDPLPLVPLSLLSVGPVIVIRQYSLLARDKVFLRGLLYQHKARAWWYQGKEDTDVGIGYLRDETG
jgi:hypothetical protein